MPCNRNSQSFVIFSVIYSCITRLVQTSSLEQKCIFLFLLFCPWLVLWAGLNGNGSYMLHEVLAIAGWMGLVLTPILHGLSLQWYNLTSHSHCLTRVKANIVRLLKAWASNSQNIMLCSIGQSCHKTAWDSRKGTLVSTSRWEWCHIHTVKEGIASGHLCDKNQNFLSFFLILSTWYLRNCCDSQFPCL